MARVSRPLRPLTVGSSLRLDQPHSTLPLVPKSLGRTQEALHTPQQAATKLKLRPSAPQHVQPPTPRPWTPLILRIYKQAAARTPSLSVRSARTATSVDCTFGCTVQ